MDYIKLDFIMTEVKPNQDMYPNRGKHDIVQAVYHDRYMEKDNPDIAALPIRLSDTQLADMCAKGFPGYNRKSVDGMKMSERLIAMDALKDYVRVYLPYYIEYFRRLISCLLSAYRGRTFAIGKDYFGAHEDTVDTYTREEIAENQVLSVIPEIGSNVLCMALVGLAGSGKSECNKIATSIFPHAILHNFSSGHRYLQIPILQMSAIDISDTKSLLIHLAGLIDMYIGHGRVYKQIMIKQHDIAKMLDYFGELVEQFHVGMVIVDEVQMISNKKSLFNHLLSLSNACHVSVCLIGTEESMPNLHKKSWFKRRFGELGLITADLGIQEQVVMESVLRQIWHYQWTYKYTVNDEPDEESVRLMVNSCMGNIDLLTTIFIKAQRIALKERNKECLTPDVIAKAVKSIEDAKELLKTEKATIEIYGALETENLKKQLKNDIELAKAREAQVVQKEAEKAFITKTKVLEDLEYRLSYVADYSPTRIEKVFDRLMSRGKGLYEMDAKQRAKLVLAEIQQEEIEKKKNKGNNPDKKTARNKKITDINVVENELGKALSGAIDDITNLQADGA